jgi:putative ABC transport system permease protein
MKWLLLAWRNVMRNRRRTLMAGGVICSGTVALLIAIGYMLATFWGLREITIHGELGHIQLGAPGQFDDFAERPLQYGLDGPATKRAEDYITKIDGVTFTMKRVLFEGLVSNGAITVAYLGQGVEPEKENKLATFLAPPIKAGDPLPKDSDPDQFQVLLAIDLARTLGVKPGDSVTLLSTTAESALNAIDVKVSGTYETGVPEYDKRALMVSVAVAQLLLKTDRISRLVTVLDDTEETERVARQIEKGLPGVELKRWIELAPFYRKVVQLYHAIFTIMGIIILLVVLMSVTNTMLMSVMERVREIGTMMAFGIPKIRIRANFWIEGAIIGAIGATVGLIVSSIAAKIISDLWIMLPAPPGRTQPYPLMIFIDYYAYSLIFIVMIALGSAAAWVPTRHIVRLKVVDALGHA